MALYMSGTICLYETKQTKLRYDFSQRSYVFYSFQVLIDEKLFLSLLHPKDRYNCLLFILV